MKILVINTVSFGTNGITSVIMNYYRAMNKNDIQMDFLAITKPLDEYINEFSRNGSHYYILQRRKNAIKYFLGLIKLMKREKYDLVHVHGNSTNIALELFAAKIAGVKVRIAHSHNTSSPHLIVHKLLYPVFRRLVTARIACGVEAGKWLFKDGDFIVLKNGIDLEKFRYDNAKGELKKQELGLKDKFVIGHIGTYWEQKNHAYIVKLFSSIVEQCPESALILIGDGPKFDEIENALHERKLGDKVIFVKQTLEVEKYMMSMDVFILPSIYEGFPVVSVEAQASALPCVFSDVVTDATNMTGLIHFVGLDDEEKWISTILGLHNSNRCSEETIQILTKNGFNIRTNAEFLRKLYFNEIGNA